MFVSILIPTHNRSAIVLQTLESLAALRIPAGVRVELILVANACTDDTRERATAFGNSCPFPVKVVEESTPGASAARNRGIAHAAGDVLLFLDDDIKAEAGLLEGLIAVLETTPADLVMGRVLLWWKDVQKPAWMTYRSEHLLSCTDYGDQIRELDKPGQAFGANLAIRRRVLEKVPGFSTDLDRKGTVPLGGGDTEFVARALDHGFRMFYAPDALVHHLVTPQRITRRYLSSVAYGGGLSKPYLMKNATRMGLLWAIIEYGTKTQISGGAVLAMKLVGKEHAAINHRIRMMSCFGIVVGSSRKLCGRPPVS